MGVWKRKENYPDKGFDIEEFKRAYVDGVQIMREWRDERDEKRKARNRKIENARRKLGLKPSKKYGGE